jgi:hypothetical protein
MNESDLKNIENRIPLVEKQRWTGEPRHRNRARFLWERKYLLKFSSPVRADELQFAWDSGMRKKESLRDGQYYWGVCRNARCARWNSEKNCFEYMRFKGHWYHQTISYPGDEELGEALFGKTVGDDVFVPWIETRPLPFEIVISNG